jgi:hypothetical protein
MESRRSFLKKTGKSALFTSMVLASSSAYPFSLISKREETGSNMRIGIIGAENSHTIGFGKMFNTDKKFPGIEVKYVWGETEEFAKKAMEKGNIPNMVSNPNDMLGKIDALIVDHRHPKYHLEAAAPFVKAGIPTFIDKPFCYRVSEGKEFLAMAREAEGSFFMVCTSLSPCCFYSVKMSARSGLPEMKKIPQPVLHMMMENWQH